MRSPPTGRSTIRRQSFLGTQGSSQAYDLAGLARRIDYGRYVLRELGADRALLHQISGGRCGRARPSVSLFADAPSHAAADRGRAVVQRPRAWSASGRPTPISDDIVLYTDEKRTTELARLHSLHFQQMAKTRSRKTAAAPTSPLGRNFVAPVGATSPIGSAASRSPPVTARLRSPRPSRTPATTIRRSWPRRWPTALAEAFAEALHRRVRMNSWAYAYDEAWDIDVHARRAIIAASARRPAIPAQPDPHGERRR